MKKFTVLLLVLVFILCGCSKQNNNNDLSSNNQQSNINNFSSKPIISFDSVAEPFRSILENKQTFYSATKKENVKISSYHRDIWQYATIDFDSDGIGEFAVMLHDGDIVILRKSGDLVMGFDFGVHSMYQINKDGIYHWNADEGNTYGCSKLVFSQNTCESVELFRVEHGGNDSITYYVAGKVVSKNEFKAAEAKINTESIVWTALN